MVTPENERADPKAGSYYASSEGVVQIAKLIAKLLDGLGGQRRLLGHPQHQVSPELFHDRDPDPQEVLRLDGPVLGSHGVEASVHLDELGVDLGDVMLRPDVAEIEIAQLGTQDCSINVLCCT